MMPDYYEEMRRSRGLSKCGLCRGVPGWDCLAGVCPECEGDVDCGGYCPCQEEEETDG